MTSDVALLCCPLGVNCDDYFDVSGGNLCISMAMFAQTRGCFCGDLISAVERVHTFVTGEGVTCVNRGGGGLVL